MKSFSIPFFHRQRKSVFLPPSINQFHRNEIIEVKRMRKGKEFFSLQIKLFYPLEIGKVPVLKKDTLEMCQNPNIRGQYD